VNPAEARVLDSSRYPPHLSEAGFMAPCPRRIRATRDGATPVTRPRTKFDGEE
jgi:hypothetical protein